MSKVNKPGSHKPENNAPKPSEAKKTIVGTPPIVPKTQANAPKSAEPTTNSAPIHPANAAGAATSGQAGRSERGKQGSGNRKPEVGGTAVTGAKSTQPKEITSTNPAQQQAESYNRQMRRRMEHLGTGPYTESPTLSVRDKKKKRLERKKQERLQEVKKVVAKGPSPKRVGTLGRRNTYFILGVVAVLALLILVFLIVRHPFW